MNTLYKNMPSFICIYSWISLWVKEYYGTPCRSLRCWCKDAPETNMTERRWMDDLPGKEKCQTCFYQHIQPEFKGFGF